MLRQNRRLTVGQTEEEQLALDTFHGVLEDVAYGKDTPRVREALVAAYVRGAQRSQKTVDFEHSTACVTKKDDTEIVGTARCLHELGIVTVGRFE